MNSMFLLFKLCAFVPLWLMLFPGITLSGQQTLNIAAASNLTRVMPELIKAFEEENEDIRVRLSLASTGNIYTQIKNGAPFDLFLAADEARPALLQREGHTRGEPFVYARGNLVLWSSEKVIFVEGVFALSSPRYKKIAIANPSHAPYGEAARKVLEEAGLLEVLQKKLIIGENISQTAQFVHTGSAQAGFIAESLLNNPAMQGGTALKIPQDTYPPILQRGVIIRRKKGNPAAAEKFRDFLFKDKAKTILKTYGYGVDKS